MLVVSNSRSEDDTDDVSILLVIDRILIFCLLNQNDASLRGISPSRVLRTSRPTRVRCQDGSKKSRTALLIPTLFCYDNQSIDPRLHLLFANGCFEIKIGIYALFKSLILYYQIAPVFM
jgi:hypothetical protein